MRQGWRHPRHARDWWRTFENYVFPRIGRRPVSEVAAADAPSGPPPPSPPLTKPGTETPSVAAATVAPKTPASPKAFKADSVTARPWGIQVGAYESITAAQIAMRRASARAPSLDGAKTTLEPSAVGPGTLYRARFLGLYKSDAQRACKTLRAAPMPCIIIRGLDPGDDPAISIRS